MHLFSPSIRGGLKPPEANASRADDITPVFSQRAISDSFILFFLKNILFMYLTERDTARDGTQAGGVGKREAGLPQSREPNAGPDPRTLGS